MSLRMVLQRCFFLLITFGATSSVYAFQSSGVFSYSGVAANCSGASCDTQLSLVTNTGTVVLTATNRGWVTPTGGNNGSGVANNYMVGLCGSSDSCVGGDAIFRNWFAFSLPVGAFATISSATLLLDVPAPTLPQLGVYNSWGPVTYTLYDTTGTPAATFIGGTAGGGAYGDLGDGAVYGARAYTGADQGTQPGITLSAAALTYLNANIGNPVILGGVADPLFGNIPVPTLSPLGLLVLGVMTLLAGLIGMRLKRRS